MKIAIDTNRYRDFCDGDTEVLRLIQKAEEIYVPFIVIAELRAGFAVGLRGLENERTLTRFLSKPRVRELFADGETTRVYAQLFRQLHSQGTPVPVNDLWMASLAVQHDLYLFTRDRHFEKMPQIPLV